MYMWHLSIVSFGGTSSVSVKLKIFSNSDRSGYHAFGILLHQAILREIESRRNECVILCTSVSAQFPQPDGLSFLDFSF